MDYINNLRFYSRKLIRELGILNIDKADKSNTPKIWHAIIEIDKKPNISITELAESLLTSLSSASRLASNLEKTGHIYNKCNVINQRERQLLLTEKGIQKLQEINNFSRDKIIQAIEHLDDHEQQNILQALKIYSSALEKARLKFNEKIKILTLPSSRIIRSQVIKFIEDIQTKEFSIPVDESINSCILHAEKYFHFNSCCNFWYAHDESSKIVGSIGLRKIDKEFLEIKKVFVDKNHRGQGLSKKLLQKALGQAKKQNFKYIVLGTVDKLKAAQKFYLKNSFKQIDKHQLPDNFDLCPLDSVFLRRKLI